MIFHQLLGISKKDFFNTHWEKDLFFSSTSIQLERISTPLYEWPHKKLKEIMEQGVLWASKNSQTVDNKFFLDDTVEGMSLVEKLLCIHDDGFTVYIKSIEKFFPEVRKIVADLETELYPMKVQFNLFMTPGGNVGLNPHFDCHDVLVWQLSGEKEWSFWKAHTQAMTDHTPSASDVKKTASIISSQQPIVSKKISANEIFYMPRGVIHAPKAISYSSHISIWLQAPLIESLPKEGTNESQVNQDNFKYF